MRAAMPPAIPRSATAKAEGAAISASAASSPAHTPASQAATRVTLIASDVPHFDDLVALEAARRLHVGHVAGFLADQRPSDRRADRDQALLEVRFVVSDDLVGDLRTAGLFLELDGGAEHHLAARVQRGRVDDLRSGELAFDLADSAFDEALLVLGGLVLGVLREVALGARLRDRLDDGVALDRLQSLRLVLELFGASFGERNRGHVEPAATMKPPPEAPAAAFVGVRRVEFS